MAQLLTVRLNKSSQEPLGFRLQGGKDFGTPLAVQKVNGGSPAERAGLQAGDALIRVNNTDVFTLRHQEAQDAIRTSGPTLELTVQRGGGTWRPAVTPTGSLPRPGSRLGSTPTPVTNTSLKANQQPSRAFGSGHNNVAKPFGYMNGDNKSQIVNKQYNTPVNMYSDQTIAETLSAQTEVLAGGVLGVNFKKNEKTYDSEKSAVFKVLQEEQNDPEPERESGAGVPPPAVTGLRHVMAPVTRPDAPLNNTGGLPVGQNICEECERLITGVFVRIKDKNLHVECFKCATCGSSLKNQGYYNLNGKLYCDIHAKLVARNNPPAPHLEPVTVPPGCRIPSNAYSTPLPPLSTNNYTNGSSSMFSPSSNLSGPKPFGSSLGSAYSPSLSPRSAPMSPARPGAGAYAPAPAPTYAPAPAPSYASAPAPAYAPAPAPAYAAAAPAPAPAAPFAPTNETRFVNANSPQKPDFKSPAEERLIKKMAKMALNGYEIGIQRKIKPADHIQSMADRIQDTVVMKHPLNIDEGSSGDSSRENTLRKPITKHLERGSKPADSIQNIGEKIKNTILSKHPMAAAYANGNAVVPSKALVTSNPAPSSQVAAAPPPPSIPTAPIPTCNDVSTTPPPPPIPSTPIPTYNVPSTPVAHKLLNGTNKYNNHVQDEITLNMTFENQIPKITNKSTPINAKQQPSYDKGVDVKTEDIYKRRNNMFEKSSFLNDTLKSQDTYEPDNKFNNNYSNTLNKRNIFEKKDTMDIKNVSDIKRNDKLNLNSNDPNIYNSIPKMFTKSDYENKSKTNSTEDLKIKSPLASNLYDNTLYDYKPILRGTNATNGNGYKSDDNTQDQTNDKLNGEPKDETDLDVIVKRREKTSQRNNDGRRDSHIIARPLSTMTSTDSADGVYICNVCEKSTRGPFITALGRIWCPEHFICVNATCRRALQDIGFVEENGQLYCEYCFEQYIAPACNKCHGKIKGDCLNAIGKHFHPECFNCVYCGKLFGNNPFFLEDGLPYCEADWNELFTTKCFACGFPVEAGDRWVEALNNNYHSQCFNCTVCKKNLEGQSFFAKGGRPFCKLHAR